MNPLFEITSEQELRALNRALLEAKFSSNPGDQDLAASSLVVDMAKRVAATMEAVEPGWSRWLVIGPERREWKAALTHAISQRAWWRKADSSARSAYVRALLAPFTVEERTCDLFAEEIENVLTNGLWYSLWRGIEGAVIRFVVQRPNDENFEEIIVAEAGDPKIIYQNMDELAVVEWLSDRGFEFVADGLLPGRSGSAVVG